MDSQDPNTPRSRVAPPGWGNWRTAGALDQVVENACFSPPPGDETTSSSAGKDLDWAQIAEAFMFYPDTRLRNGVIEHGKIDGQEAPGAAAGGDTGTALWEQHKDGIRAELLEYIELAAMGMPWAKERVIETVDLVLGLCQGRNYRGGYERQAVASRFRQLIHGSISGVNDMYWRHSRKQN